MKKVIKNLIPPLLVDKYKGLINYQYFLKYKKLVAQNIDLKDLHKGERCFLMGSGPSIKKEDLKPLKNEIVFALNNFYVHQDFDEIMSGNTKKYYMAAPIHSPQTTDEWKDWLSDMEKNVSKETNMIFGINRYKENIKFVFDKYDLFKEHKINWYYTGIDTKESYRFNRKHIDASNMIWNSYSVSVYAIVMAIYMGFEEIYLLGMDHDYFLHEDEKDMRMYKDAIHQKDEFKRAFGDDFYINEFNRQYKIFSQYQSLNLNGNSKIYNASDGGILKIFPKVKLKNILNK